MPECINFFRIKSVDIDGNFTYSKTIRLENLTANGILISPSPIKDRLTIGKLSGNETIFVINTTGALVEKITSTSSSVEINTTKWAKGLFFIHVINQQGKKISEKVIKE